MQNASRFARNASLINRFTLFLWTAFRIPRDTANPTRNSVCCEADEKTKAFIGFLSYFLPQAMTLVKDPNPLRVVIDGCKRGKNAPSFQGLCCYFSLLTESFFLPAARRLLMTFRPFFVDILARNP
jgi:hypothetical protein